MAVDYDSCSGWIVQVFHFDMCIDLIVSALCGGKYSDCLRRERGMYSVIVPVFGCEMYSDFGLCDADYERSSHNDWNASDCSSDLGT